MFKSILMPTDGSELSLRAVKQGILMAKFCGARAIAMTVQPPLTDFLVEGVTITVSDADRRSVREEFTHRLDAARAEAQAQGVELELHQVEHREPWRAIIELAKTEGCDLIVMASHGRRGVSALLIGSETQKLLTHSSIPVLVYR
ncbi:MAG: universal stress protein [Hyphomicrobiaceae bacterium]